MVADTLATIDSRVADCTEELVAVSSESRMDVTLGSSGDAALVWSMLSVRSMTTVILGSRLRRRREVGVLTSVALHVAVEPPHAAASAAASRAASSLLELHSSTNRKLSVTLMAVVMVGD